MIREGSVEALIAGNTWTIDCRGYIDETTAAKLHRTLEWCMSTAKIPVYLNLSDVDGLSRESLSVVLNALLVAYERGSTVTIEASAGARADLDEAGLWWVGVIGDGIAAELVMGDAFQSFLDEHRMEG